MWRTKPTDFVTKVGKKFKLLSKPHNYGTRWRTKPTDFVTKVGKQINAKIRKLLLILADTILQGWQSQSHARCGQKFKINLQIMSLENKWRMQAQETLLGCLQ
jgi:hypothetical protein